MNKTLLRLVRNAALAVVMALGLAGCDSGGDFSDLHAKIAELKARPRGRIEPPPEFVPVASVSYSVHQLRSPFTPSYMGADINVPQGRQVVPDLTRPKEYLERFPVESLRMVGTISREAGSLEVLIQDPTGSVTRIKVGDHLGKNFGRVVEARIDSVSLLEIVPDGHDGWVEAPRTIKLSE